MGHNWSGFYMYVPLRLRGHGLGMVGSDGGLGSSLSLGLYGSLG